MLESLAGLILIDEGSLKKCFQTHLAVIKSGAALARATRDLDRLGKETEQRAAKDKNKTIIKGVMKASVNFWSVFQELLSIQEECEQQQHAPAPEVALLALTDEAGENEKDGQASPAEQNVDADAILGNALAKDVQTCSLELVGLETGLVFDACLDSEVVMDCACQHLAGHAELVNKAMQALGPLIADVVNGKWKEPLNSDSSIEDVLMVASNSLLKMKVRGQPLGGLVDGLDQDRGIA